MILPSSPTRTHVSCAHEIGDLLGRLALVRDRDDLDARAARAASAKSSGKRPLPAISPMRSGIAGIRRRRPVAGAAAPGRARASTRR